MHWLTAIGIGFVAVGTFLTIWGQGLDSKKSTDLLSSQNRQLLAQNKQQLDQNELLLSQNNQLQKDNVQLRSDVGKIRQSNEELEKRVKPSSGFLTPDNKSTPNKVSIPPKALSLFLGNSVAYNSSFPHTVIEVGTEPLLVINKQGNNVTITAKFFSTDGKIVAELKENQFYINQSNSYRMERPNDHSLIVYDEQTNEALNVYFLNPAAIKLTGRFYFPKHQPIIITEEWLMIGNNNKMSRMTFGENRVDIHLE
jgi:hypothetical protein